MKNSFKHISLTDGLRIAETLRGNYYAYNSVLGKGRFINRIELQYLDRIKNGNMDGLEPDERILSNLFSDYYIKYDPKWNEYVELEPHVRKYFNDLRTGKTITKLMLLVTEDCMLHCSYCYMADVPGSGNPVSIDLTKVNDIDITKQQLRKGASTTFRNVPKMMSWELAKKSIDSFYSIIKKNNQKIVHVRFHGGEPFIYWKIIRKSIEYIDEIFRGIRVVFRFNTNGILVTEEIASFLSTRDVDIEVSVDGTQEIHDQLRFYKNGKGSFAQAIQATKMFLNKGMSKNSINLACTLSRVNYKNLRSLVDLSYNLGLNHLEINVFYFSHPMDLLDKIDERVNCLVDARMYGVKKNISVDGKWFKLFENLSDPVINYCGRFGQQLGVDTAGNIIGCSGHLEPLGHLDKLDDVFKSPFYLHTTRRVIGTIEECRNCSVEGMCAGGCLAEAHRSHNDVYVPDRKECYFREKIVAKLIMNIENIILTDQEEEKDIAYLPKFGDFYFIS